jgi:hypothetical protein
MGMATVAADRELIQAVVAEMAAGIDCALQFWMAQIEAVYEDNHMTSLGRLQAIKDILANYRSARAGADSMGSGHAA